MNAVNYPTATTEAEIAETGTYATEKYFRANGRWAKVMRTKLSDRVLLSLAFGREGETQAFEVWSNRADVTAVPMNLRNVRRDAIDYVLRG